MTNKQLKGDFPLFLLVVEEQIQVIMFWFLKGGTDLVT